MTLSDLKQRLEEIADMLDDTRNMIDNQLAGNAQSLLNDVNIDEMLEKIEKRKVAKALAEYFGVDTEEYVSFLEG